MLVLIVIRLVILVLVLVNRCVNHARSQSIDLNINRLVSHLVQIDFMEKKTLKMLQVKIRFISVNLVIQLVLNVMDQEKMLAQSVLVEKLNDQITVVKQLVRLIIKLITYYVEVALLMITVRNALLQPKANVQSVINQEHIRYFTRGNVLKHVQTQLIW